MREQVAEPVLLTKQARVAVEPDDRALPRAEVEHALDPLAVALAPRADAEEPGHVVDARRLVGEIERDDHALAPAPRPQALGPCVDRHVVAGAQLGHRVPEADGSPPNNWLSTFGGPAWTLDDTTGQYYLHNFTAAQPDLNWWNDEVRDEFDRILRFWFDRGVAGFRIDVAHVIIKDRELRDNPPVTDDDDWFHKLLGQKPVYTQCRPEVHDVHRRFRAVADSYDPPRMLVGETYVLDVPTVASFYGAGDELNLAFNIPLLHTQFEAKALRAVVEETEAEVPPGSWPVWTAGNHDLSRFPTRWGEGDPAKARCALMMILTLRGAAFLYYGDEIGMPDTDVPEERLRDPVGIRFHPLAGRDPERTPMQWSPAPGGGFTSDPGVEPWLPYGDFASCNVEDERHDPGSMLALCRDLIGLRDAVPELRSGDYATIERTPEGMWAWRRVQMRRSPVTSSRRAGSSARLSATTTRSPRRHAHRLSGRASIAT